MKTWNGMMAMGIVGLMAFGGAAQRWATLLAAVVAPLRRTAPAQGQRHQGCMGVIVGPFPLLLHGGGAGVFAPRTA